MIRFAKLAVVLGAVSAIIFPSVASATGWGQIEQGDIYRVKDITTNSAFADNISAACNDTVLFRVRIHNTGPSTVTNVKVAATLNGASSTSHGSQISLSADNNLNNMVVTANSGVNTSQASTATYVAGSTQLLDNGGSVIKNLSDGILNGGVNIGSVGPLTSDTEVVQFQAKISCETAPVTFTATASASATATATASASANCPAGSLEASVSASATASATASASATATSTVSQADADAKAKAAAQADADAKAKAQAQVNAQAQAQVNANSDAAKNCSQPTTPTTPTTTLPNTGAGDVIGIFSGVSAFGAAGHYISRRFRR